MWRRQAPDGQFEADTLGIEGEGMEGEPLLVPVMVDGELRVAAPDLAVLRARTAAQVAALPAGVADLDRPTEYPVHISPELERLAAALQARDS